EARDRATRRKCGEQESGSNRAFRFPATARRWKRPRGPPSKRLILRGISPGTGLAPGTAYGSGRSRDGAGTGCRSLLHRRIGPAPHLSACLVTRHKEDRMRLEKDPFRIDLRSAKLCMELDCNTVFDATMYRHCPTCGSIEFYPLESWLNRD